MFLFQAAQLIFSLATNWTSSSSCKCQAKWQIAGLIADVSVNRHFVSRWWLMTASEGHWLAHSSPFQSATLFTQPTNCASQSTLFPLTSDHCQASRRFLVTDEKYTHKVPGIILWPRDRFVPYQVAKNLVPFFLNVIVPPLPPFLQHSGLVCMCQGCPKPGGTGGGTTLFFLTVNP